MHPHLFIFGFGYTARFLAKKLRLMNIPVTATTRNQDEVGFSEEFGCEVILFSAQSVAQHLARASHILISTPPGVLGDPVLAEFKNVLEECSRTIQWIGYLSSTSVYGDHQGHWVDESSETFAHGILGKQRLTAENQWILFEEKNACALNIFRLAGIYGPHRNALARLKAGKKDTIIKDGHFFSRIHVEDICLTLLAAMQHLTPGVFIYNLADNEPTPASVVDAYAASLLQLPPLQETPYNEATLSTMAQAFYAQNKRVSNAKMKALLHAPLCYPTYREGLAVLFNEHSNELS